MYRLGKRAISQFIRSGCRRRLRLDLYAAQRDRDQSDAPAKDTQRPGLALLTRQGKAYEREKFLELERFFPDLVVRGALTPGLPEEDRAFAHIRLRDHIDNLQEHQLALEAQFEITNSFRDAHRLRDLESGSAIAGGHGLAFEDLRPDIIQVVPAPNEVRRVISASGALVRIPATDMRLGLRIIDIKISGEPSPAHFSELAYYGMALAGWLDDTRRTDRFVVLSDAAIWPGSHDGSTMGLLDREDRDNNVTIRELGRYLEAFGADLEAMPPEVVIGRIQRFLSVDLREVLAEQDWRALPWHIDTRCSGCDYLGYRWSRHDDEASESAPPSGPAPDVRYCWPMAEQEGHLSRVAGLTEGASGKLREVNVDSVTAVSALPAGSPAFERHQALRAKRTVLRQRAATLNQQLPAAIPDRAGTSAVLPRFADVRVAISADFDIGSGITFALGYRLEYGIPTGTESRGDDGRRFTRQFRTIERPLLVLERSLTSEGDILRLWLEHLVDDVHRAQRDVLAGYHAHGATTKQDVTIQFYLWDRLTFDHLCRVFGRHLERLQRPVRAGHTDVSPMAWIFPADAVLDEPDFVGRASPITIVSDAVNSLMAAPIPHHYGVIDLANSIDADQRILASGQRWGFHVNKFYRDPLSDQIPSERGHEIWERGAPFADRDYQWHQETVRNVVRRKLHAISYVSQRLSLSLSGTLTAEAPKVGSVFQPSDRLTGVGDDGQIIFQHARLMAAAERLDIELLMAMPPHEREARFRSARVERILGGTQRRDTLRALSLGASEHDPRVFALQLSDRSREARLKEGEYTWSFFPEADLPLLQDLTVAQFKARNPRLAALHPTQGWDNRKRLREALTVKILKLDRGAALLAVEVDQLLFDAANLGILQMNIDGAHGRFAILDPTAMDVFTRKLRRALSDPTGIRHPPIAQARPLFPALGVARVRSGRPRGAANDPPAAEVVWDADVMAGTATGATSGEILRRAERALPGLTPRQQQAIAASTQQRLALWWGPPGTGKSRTAQAYITALAADAVARGQALSIAIVGFTWIAIDNVAARLPELLQTAGVVDQVQLARLNSTDTLNGVDPRLHNVVVPMSGGNTGARASLQQRLSDRDGVNIVASTVDQISKLGEPIVCAPLFDVMLIDEASQLDLGHALVGLTKLADGGRVTVVGDDKQMSPIHPIEAPEGLEHLLGSIYDFYRHYRLHEGPAFAIAPTMLNVSFRSNREIVEFVREAGYGEDLSAAPANADIRIATARPLPDQAPPTGWPSTLQWSESYSRILAANEPLAAVIHSDRYSSQRNDDEADLVASLVLSLYHAQLLNLGEGNASAYSAVDFFRKGVGIVTPHRAQQAAVFDRLATHMPNDVDRNDIFSSIDTVERFQGQEKALMIASFGLGDADQIAAEERFLFSLNRFNVAASRAQAKFVAIVSRQLVDHLPRDRQALEESRLLKHFVDGFLSRTIAIDLPGLGACDLKLR